jgi:ribosomal-protein-alanine N-acetyltransferase
MAMPGAVSYIASDGGEPAGFLIARRAADEAEIITLGTLHALRRRGVARHLIGRLAEALAASGVRSLLIEAAVGNAAALKLYQAFGFARAGTRPGYYRLPGGGREDAVLMRLRL